MDIEMENFQQEKDGRSLADKHRSHKASESKLCCCFCCCFCLRVKCDSTYSGGISSFGRQKKSNVCKHSPLKCISKKSGCCSLQFIHLKLSSTHNSFIQKSPLHNPNPNCSHLITPIYQLHVLRVQSLSVQQASRHLMFGNKVH